MTPRQFLQCIVELDEDWTDYDEDELRSLINQYRCAAREILASPPPNPKENP